MIQIDQLKSLQREGRGPQDISRRMNLDRKTIAKYMAQDDFDQRVQSIAEGTSKLDHFKKTIIEWLDEDRRMRFKQRHTAKRVHERLQKEFPATYDCSYPLVQRYIKMIKTERGESNGFLELVWTAGEAQADFGEADILTQGCIDTVKYLVLSFPSSNAAYTQVFHGETAECVAQGLKDIFHHIGGVPLRIVFDNASGVGRRVGEKITMAELFLRFKCHYGFSVSFCNPSSGNEKGNVENKVGYMRRNFFVPIPEVEDLVEWNTRLLLRCEEDFERTHYKKVGTIAELFTKDRASLTHLPAKTFNAERFEKVVTDGYGKFCVDGKHWYATSPDLAHQECVVGFGAHTVTVYDDSGCIQCVHQRNYGSSRSDSSNYATCLEALLKKPGAWRNSQIRQVMNEPTRACLDGLSKKERTRILGTLSSASGTVGFDMALASLVDAVQRGTMDDYSIRALATRKACDGLGIEGGQGPDLQAYDTVLMIPEDSQ